MEERTPHHPDPPRLMGFDVGLARIGVARSTALGDGEPLTTLQAKDRPRRAIMDEIAQLARQHEIEGFVVGLPQNMDGSLGAQARHAQAFARSLRRAFPAIPVAMEDERLSTEAALERLRERGMRGDKARRSADAVAASLIVEWRLARLRMDAP